MTVEQRLQRIEERLGAMQADVSGYLLRLVEVLEELVAWLKASRKGK